jgi:signal transduction histidine kinase/CheY-like chemotaxis protein
MTSAKEEGPRTTHTVFIFCLLYYTNNEQKHRKVTMTMSLPNLIIAVAYFSIPLQLMASLWQYPRFASMPYNIVGLLVLFALFIFLCGTGHLLRSLGKADTDIFYCNNILTAFISLTTALYLLPLIPNLFGIIDQNIRDSIKQNEEIAESKAKLLTFMAFLCHEIRNPLFAITSSAEFLADTEMTEEQAIGVGSISDSCLLMLRLVNDVLDLSKIDAGKLQLEDRDFDLHRLLENLEVNMRLQIQQKHGGKVKLDFEVSKDVPQNVYGDSTRVLQIVYNLISNACKFTEQGFIKLSIGLCDDESINGITSSTDFSDSSASLEDDDHASQFSMGLLDSAEEGTIRYKNRGVHLKIVVSDSGVGIDPERLKDIFKPYSQAKLSDYRIHGGTGLGLSIISSLLKILGGSIQVESNVGKGTTFTLAVPLQVPLDQSKTIEYSQLGMSDTLLAAQRLPVYTESFKAQNKNLPSIALSNDCDEGVTSAAAQATPIMPYKTNMLKKEGALPSFNFPPGKGVVLVTDDNMVNRKIIVRMLQFYNIESVEAVNGREAVDIIRASQNVTGDSNAPHFGLILMDLQMPVMDGYEAMETLRGHGVSLPIVALTANALSREKQRAFTAGANDFQTKPILRKDLHALCNRFLITKVHTLLQIPNGDATFLVGR